MQLVTLSWKEGGEHFRISVTSGSEKGSPSSARLERLSGSGAWLPCKSRPTLLSLIMDCDACHRRSGIASIRPETYGNEPKRAADSTTDGKSSALRCR